MDRKEKYREFCIKEHTIPIFSQSWWLDSVCGKSNWDIILVEKGGQIVGSMPIFFEKSHLSKLIVMPKLTQTLGPYIKYQPNQNYEKRLSFEKKIMFEIIDKIPYSDLFSQNFSYEINNWLPFKFKGFNQTTLYTYIIEDLTDMSKVYSNFRSNIKTDIKKAESQLKVHAIDDLELLYQTNKMTFARQDKKIPHSFDLLKTLDNECKIRDSRKILIAMDGEQKVHAGIYLVWDKNSAYYLLGGADPNFRKSGATSLLLWEAIKYSANVTKKFNFEGSMVESIEKHFRAFGGKQTPYFRISKTNSKLIKIRQLFKELFK